MAYYIDIFSPETYDLFSQTDKAVSGFSSKKRKMAEGIKPGDKLICYVTKLSRWVGVLEVTSRSFMDDKPILGGVDPYVVRFNVKPVSWLSMEAAVPINSDVCWNNLSFTKTLSRDSSRWTIVVRSSLRKLDDEDGQFIENLLKAQSVLPTAYPLDANDLRKLKAPTVKTKDSKQVTVSIPENESSIAASAPGNPRESIRIQALLAEIGERMNMKIWIPRSDKQRVMELWKPRTDCILSMLPLNYDEATLNTIENIDVLWIKGRSIVRAFEVEHTTSIYSGILRMADLMALQPNLHINAHIVAPIERKEKVFEEITRPVFTFLEKGPLFESCSFLSYEAVTELSREKRLEYMTDAVLEEYEEYAESVE